jgi:signal transduction histidine kinase
MSLKQYFGSMAGRLMLFLLIGVIGSATLALGLADAYRQSDLKRINFERVVDRLQDFISLINSAPPQLRAQLIARGIPGLHPPVGTEKLKGTDGELSDLLASRLGASSRAEQADPSTCLPLSSARSFYAQINCWLLSAPLADHSTITLVAFSPRLDTFDRPGRDLLFLSVLAIGAGLIAFFAARMAAAPLTDLSLAARALGGDLDRSPLAERGPYEVRNAIRAFNTMQQKLRDNVVERTRILASLTHDLQTPMTRLRLRLEKVDDIALRSRLIDDLDGMQSLIKQGLDLCRGTQSEEPFVSIALDSLLESVVEDAAEGGKPISLVQRSGYDVEAQPSALQRCLANLLDNALNYGGGAEVSAAMEEGEIHIRIRDFGPGIPTEHLDSVFEPFVRLDGSSTRSVGGIGLGLTIAKALAEKNDARLILSNHPHGGLEASLILRRGLVAGLTQREAAQAGAQPELDPVDTK